MFHKNGNFWQCVSKERFAEKRQNRETNESSPLLEMVYVLTAKEKKERRQQKTSLSKLHYCPRKLEKAIMTYENFI